MKATLFLVTAKNHTSKKFNITTKFAAPYTESTRLGWLRGDDGFIKPQPQNTITAPRNSRQKCKHAEIFARAKHTTPCRNA